MANTKTNDKRIRILVLSDSMCGVTGFGQQTRDVFVRLARQPEYEIVHVAWNYHHAPLDGAKIHNGPEIPFKILPGHPQQPYAQSKLQDYIRQYQPDIVWVLLDSFMLHLNDRNPTQPWIQHIDFAPAKFVMYFPTDGGTLEQGFPVGCEHVLKRAHHAVSMSQFGQQQVKREFDMDVDHIPHGVDTAVFHPVEDKEACKAKYGLQGKFVVGVVARNQPRKNMPDLEFFADFVRRVEEIAPHGQDVALLLHTDPDDPAGFVDLRQIFKIRGCEHKVYFTGMKWHEGIPVNEMKNVYGAMDVFLLPTSGEGFGVPIIEAMACGVPVVATNYTTTPELICDNGQTGLPIALAREYRGSWTVPRAFIDPSSFVKQLERLYLDKDLRIQMGKTGIEKVKKFYDFETVIAPQWDTYFKQVVKQ